MIELAEEIGQHRESPMPRLLHTSGSEANDTALMLATSYRNSNEILAMRHSYQGGLSLLKQSPANQRGYRHGYLVSPSTTFRGPTGCEPLPKYARKGLHETLALSTFNKFLILQRQEMLHV
ncbi:MAG: hypothetical protein Ct9H90mP5_11440 [Acidimicrobiaceae bacterium]|nr:MAG: hypothetical protein Ct9H90mP5_11440 [Acidimicrobiaceae bacterium]